MSNPRDDEVLGRIAVHYKLVSQEQLGQAALFADPGTVGASLLEMGFISREQLTWLEGAHDQYVAKKGQGALPSAPRPGEAPQPSASAPRPSAPAPAARPSAPAPQAPASAPRPSAPAPAPSASAPRPRGALPELAQILSGAVAMGASDVHLHGGAPLQMRVNGSLRELKAGVFDAQEIEAILKRALTDDQRARLEKDHELDLALALPGVGRFRASLYKQQRGWDGVFRPIAPEPPSLGELGLPRSLERLTEFHQGLVLITGPAGCGKSSTLAALVRAMNATRHDHIITIEDPIEFVHQPQGCVVNQREAGRHTRSFANALRAALREDPDIIVIGELRDLETISLAITAAETGHLVMGTLHTNNAIRTINRVLDVFPPKQQSQIRAMVSESLRAIVSQRLVPTADGSRRVPVAELLFVKKSVANLIREDKTFQIRSIMQTGRAEGMALLDDSLLELVKSGTITKDVARRVAEDPRRFA